MEIDNIVGRIIEVSMVQSDFVSFYFIYTLYRYYTIHEGSLSIKEFEWKS